MIFRLRFIPNALCVLRMLLVVPVMWLLKKGDFASTLWLFAFAAATDGLDGFLAKRCGWTSELGKILDPLADKILLVGTYITLAIVDLVPVWLAAVVVGRDVVITVGAILYNWIYGYPNGRPTGISKLNTLCQIVFALLIVGSHAAGRVPDLAITILGALVFVTTVVSGLDYVITYARKAIEATRERRHVAS
jgi:cardiolipin synthase (CMP-forming)